MSNDLHPVAPNAQSMALHDILEQLIHMQGLKAEVLNEAILPCLIESAQVAKRSLEEAHRQQLELLEAFQMLLLMLDAAAEEPLRSAGLMHLLAPLVEKLAISIVALNAVLH